jgi:hypothetical protein
MYFSAMTVQGVSAVAATGWILFNVLPSDGEQITLGDGANAKTYRFKTTLAQVNDVLIYPQSDAYGRHITARNLVRAITAGAGAGTSYYNGTTAHATVTASITDSNSDTTVLLTAKTAGAGGNAEDITPLTTLAAKVDKSGSTLLGGSGSASVGQTMAIDWDQKATFATENVVVTKA